MAGFIIFGLPVYPINVRTAEPWSGNFFRNPQIKTKKSEALKPVFKFNSGKTEPRL